MYLLFSFLAKKNMHLELTREYQLCNSNTALSFQTQQEVPLKILSIFLLLPQQSVPFYLSLEKPFYLSQIKRFIIFLQRLPLSLSNYVKYYQSHLDFQSIIKNVNLVKQTPKVLSQHGPSKKERRDYYLAPHKHRKGILTVSRGV